MQLQMQLSCKQRHRNYHRLVNIAFVNAIALGTLSCKRRQLATAFTFNPGWL
jgi:hypothetical protein